MDVFNIVHITDLHFESRLNDKAYLFEYGDRAIKFGKLAFDLEVARAFSKWLYFNYGGLDGLIVTGDIAHTGLNNDLLRGREFLCAEYNEYLPTSSAHDGEPTIGFSRHPLLLLPGNHDRFFAENNRKPGCSNFDTVFGEYWTHGARVAARRGMITSNETGASIFFIAADFTLRGESIPGAGPFDYLGQGKVYEDTLNQLKEITVQVKSENEGTPIVWLSHFPYYCSDHSHRLIDEDDLVEAANKMGVRYILSGHTHALEVVDSSCGRVQCLVGGSLCSNSDLRGLFTTDMHAFQRIEFLVDDGEIADMNVVPYVFDLDNGAEFRVLTT